jgi:hypothetical protein
VDLEALKSSKESGLGPQEPEAVRADIRDPAKGSSLPHILFGDPPDRRNQGLEELEALGVLGGFPPTYLEPILGTLPPNHQHNQIGEGLGHRVQSGAGGVLKIASLAQSTGHLIEEPHP